MMALEIGINSSYHHTMHATFSKEMEHLLYATGDALNHAKCFWYGITWIFSDNRGCKMQDLPDPDDPDIQLPAGGNLDTKYTIQCMATSKGIYTLSIHLAPVGNDCDEFDYQ